MRFNKLAGTLAAATISLAAMTGVANAQLTIIGQTSPGLVNYTNGGNLTVSGGTTYFTRDGANVLGNTPANITFTTSSPGAFVNNAGAFMQNFGGGSFTVTSQANPLNVLLSGTFLGSRLTGTIGGDSGGLQLIDNTLTYGPGSLFPAGFLTTGGSLSVAFQPTSSFALTGGGTLASFSGIDLINYSAVRSTVVPEPSEWLAMGMAATSVGGLMFRAKLKLRSKRQQVAA
ncbi:MAG: hypothetical protein V4671_29520 [Armatimonadota bacterium]